MDKYKSIKNDFIGSIILPACGNSSDLKLQETFSANTFLDRVSHNIFKKKYKNYKSGKFRTIHGNDETVFEAVGYEIPSISITRYPFKEYHSNKDTPNIISDYHIKDTLDTVLSIINELDKQKIYKFVKTGLFSYQIRNTIYILTHGTLQIKMDLKIEMIIGSGTKL